MHICISAPGGNRVYWDDQHQNVYRSLAFLTTWLWIILDGHRKTGKVFNDERMIWGICHETVRRVFPVFHSRIPGCACGSCTTGQGLMEQRLGDMSGVLGGGVNREDFMDQTDQQYTMAEVASDTNEVLFLLQKIESIIDSRLIGEVEPLDDEIELIEAYQKRKAENSLNLHEI